MSSEIVTNTGFQEMGALLRSARSIVVLSHVRPDGDALGSQLGLALSLRSLGKKVRVINQDGVPDSIAFLPGAEFIEAPEQVAAGNAIDADIVVVCDTASRKRVGDDVAPFIPEGVPWLNIDHHISNERYGDYYYIDPVSPATGQIIYQFLKSQNFPIDRDVSENLFVAISTDTGSFQFPNTTAETFRAGAALIDQGAAVGDISQALYENYPLRRILLLGELLKVLEIGHGGQRASWAMTLEMAERLGIQASDTDGLIDHIRSIEGVVVAAFFQEGEDGYVRASLRSKDPRVDVCVVCQKFNGGGHKLAAGVRLRASLAEAQTKVLNAIDEALERSD
ncbi:MAG: bifunctional oligoribonuclease/PAP phosphatase NrnA [Verrucomicrobia bacterium]|nr:bifunctional oligoribonuclease/PAP phosphatase NrnA [Verrucomicrobiota bacterium]